MSDAANKANPAYTNLPKGRDDIDWDAVAKNYDVSILSPFHKDMIIPDERGIIRNNLVSELLDMPESLLEQYDILDLGCGPGNLISATHMKVKNLVGVDGSQEALNTASERAKKYGVQFEGIQADMRTLDLGRKFDIIISVNSILPSKRSDVLRMLERIKMHLKPMGRLMAIFPSYDTTLYLQDLLFLYYKAKFNSEERAMKMVEMFRKEHLVDDNKCIYADDKANIQCYHTPETLCGEIAQAGLQMIRLPTKVYYPWELTGKYGYGNFPGAPEEIWDWYIEARAD